MAMAALLIIVFRKGGPFAGAASARPRGSGAPPDAYVPRRRQGIQPRRAAFRQVAIPLTRRCRLHRGGLLSRAPAELDREHGARRSATRPPTDRKEGRRGSTAGRRRIQSKRSEALPFLLSGREGTAAAKCNCSCFDRVSEGGLPTL